MNVILRVLPTCCFLVPAVLFTGCSAVQTNKFFAESIPPVATPAYESAGVSAELSNPPDVKPVLLIDRLPSAPMHRISLPNPDLTQRISQAELSYMRGERFYRQGEPDKAREQFDLALSTLLDTPEVVPDRKMLNPRIEELSERISRFDSEGLAAGDPSEEKASYDAAPIDSIPEMTFPVDPKLKEQVNELLKATSSQLPLEINDSVLSYISYFSGRRGRGTLVAGMRRSAPYRRMISRILDEEGVPQELIYLAQAESGFYPRARSVKGATGMWQFMRFCGNEYGLHQTRFSDDRMDPEKATRAAARHLRDLYNHFGDWYLAMAAYNCGSMTVDRAVERTGYADFWELRRLEVLPGETKNYVPIVIALAIISKQPAAYDLTNIPLDPPLEYDAVKVDVPTNLNLVADVTEASMDNLIQMNPALLSTVAPAGYEIRVPRGSASALVAAIEAIPQEKRETWRAHRVGEGDTLSSIASQYRINTASLREANQVDGSFTDDVEAGDLLIIPSTVKPKTAKAPATRKAVKRSSRSRRRS
jgi:membrane-bound lytic murein transglycosylase D